MHKGEILKTKTDWCECDKCNCDTWPGDCAKSCKCKYCACKPEGGLQEPDKIEKTGEEKDEFLSINLNLARVVGLREAAIITRFQYRMNLAQYKDGISKTLSELQQEFFPWESVRGLKRIFQKLKEKNILKVEGFTNPRYRINQKAIDRLTRK